MVVQNEAFLQSKLKAKSISHVFILKILCLSVQRVIIFLIPFGVGALLPTFL